MSTQPIAKCDEHASWLKRLFPAAQLGPEHVFLSTQAAYGKLAAA